MEGFVARKKESSLNHKIYINSEVVVNRKRPKDYLKNKL